MKIFLKLFFIFLLSFNFLYALKQEEIKPTDYVTDYTESLSSEQILELSTLLGNLEKEKNIPIAVIIVPNMSGDYIESYSYKLYERLGIGNDKEEKKGLLWLVAKDDRQMRMEVGYGLEPYITDSITKNIQDNLVRPLFKEDKYFEGIKIGLENLLNVLNGGEIKNTTRKNNFGFSWEDIFTFIVFGLVIFVNVLGWLFAIIARTKSWWLGGVAALAISAPIFLLLLGATVISGGLIFFVTIVGLIFDYFISKNYKYWQSRIPLSNNGENWNTSNSPAWWAGGTWGPGSGGFKSGGSGFGGFGGGGFSGGGGSSSSW